MELYIHIPFCIRKCEYCSFISFQADTLQKDIYIDALLEEARIRKDEFTEPLKTIYIGGGTPSLLSSSQLRKLVSGLCEYVSADNCFEFTIEANPGTLTEEFVKTSAELGINRFSLGMQAYQKVLLKRLGRIHTYTDVMKSVELLKKNHIENYNLDLIFGCPGQSYEDWIETLRAAISLQPSHISTYGLIPEEGTPLFSRLEKKEYALPEQETERDMYDYCIRILSASGYHQYEISNFALTGFECCHNIGYWTQIPYIGLGVSAASMIVTEHAGNAFSCIRKKNPDSLADYYRMVYRKDKSVVESEIVGPEESRFETMMLSLRMNRGINEQHFFEMHGVSIAECYGPQLSEMEKKGLMKHVNGAWSLTRKGMDIQNAVLLEFMN